MVPNCGTMVSSQNEHSRWYAHELDPALPNPPAGTLAGGANSSIQDPYAQSKLTGCVAQFCYIDDIQSWSTNEEAINWNAALAKTVPFGRDGLRRLDFRVDTTNLLNHVNYSAISTVVNSATFGSVTGAAAMRVIYFTTRVNF